MKSKKILITGSLGLIGFEATNFFLKKGFNVVGIDNDIRGKLLNIKTQYYKKIQYLDKNYKDKYIHNHIDIRDIEKLENFIKSNEGVDLIIHTAAQTSHDWSTDNPFTDFSINALGTLNLLELYRKYYPKATFIFTSTNKVYGDLVNNFKLQESATRFDLNKSDKNYFGVNEGFSIDQSKHSLFGVSKASADLLVQEYGRYFDLKTGTFRLGVVSGIGQNGAFEQGFLSYMIQRVNNDKIFTIIGFKGKQVRDIIHSKDVAAAFYLFYKNPKKGEVFNLGGSRENSVSILELIKKINKISGKRIQLIYSSKARAGDHKWWITDCTKFKKNYPSWKIKYNVDDIILDIYGKNNDI